MQKERPDPSLTLDVRERRLVVDGRVITLQPRVFDTLVYLVERKGRLVSRNELLDSVWAGTFVTENALSRCIREIRRALGDDAYHPRFLQTLPRTGYRFIADVRRIGGPKDDTGGAIQSIAVLPFKPLVAAARDEALEIGMAETLIMRLSNIGRLAVRPLSAVRRYTDPHQDPLAAGSEQNVDAVLDGSLQRSGPKLRVSIRLLKVSDGTALWAEQFDEAFTDVFSVQDSIAGRVARALEVNLTDKETRLITKRDTSNTDAYRSYLIGRLQLGRYEPASSEKSIEYFKEAIAIDPQYALALVGWSEACLALASVGLHAREYYGEAKRLAARALEIDAELGEAYSVLATIGWEHDWDRRRAAELFGKAISLRPNVAQVRFAYANFCGYMGDADTAIAEARAALHIDPLSPMNNALLAAELYLGRRHEEAVEQAEKTIEIAPAFAFGPFFLGLALLQLGKRAEAVESFEKAHSLSDRPDLTGVLGYAYAMNGRPDEARRLLDDVEQSPIAAALIHVGLGEMDEAFHHLRRTLGERSWHIHLLHVDPLFDAIRSDPRSDALLRRAGLC